MKKVMRICCDYFTDSNVSLAEGLIKYRREIPILEEAYSNLPREVALVTTEHQSLYVLLSLHECVIMTCMSVITQVNMALADLNIDSGLPFTELGFVAALTEPGIGANDHFLPRVSLLSSIYLSTYIYLSVYLSVFLSICLLHYAGS